MANIKSDVCTMRRERERERERATLMYELARVCFSAA